MGAEVFNSFDVDIEITKLVSKTENYTSNFSINNSANRRVFPTLEITTVDGITLDSITNNGQTISFNSISLNSSDTLNLDFKNQSYTKNGNNIIDSISNIDMIYLEADKVNDFSFNYSGDLDVSITYHTYSVGSREKYLESFKITKNDDYKKKRPFNSNKVVDKKLTSESYSFNMSQMPINWGLYEDIKNGEEFRIKYIETNDHTNVIFQKYLVGVTFGSWDRGFSQQGDMIITNVSGDAIDLL